MSQRLQHLFAGCQMCGKGTFCKSGHISVLSSDIWERPEDISGFGSNDVCAQVMHIQTDYNTKISCMFCIISQKCTYST